MPPNPDDKKSVARLVGAHGDGDVDMDWATEYVHASCKVLGPDNKHEVLGIAMGIPGCVGEQFMHAVGTVRGTHASLTDVEDPATELTLARRCADVCKVTHLLRANGDAIPTHACDAFDSSMRSSLERILAAPLDWASWAQATSSVPNAGLGFRCGSDTALPAFIASRVAARPFALGLAHAFEEAQFLPCGIFAEAYDAHTQQAVVALKNTLPDAAAADIDAALVRGASVA